MEAPMAEPATAVYRQQGFGGSLGLKAASACWWSISSKGSPTRRSLAAETFRRPSNATVPVLALAREQGWPVAHSRIVYADDDSDTNVFSQPSPGMLTLKEHGRPAPSCGAGTAKPGELVVRKNVPSAFFGTTLAPWLTQRGVRTLVVAGCVTSGCVRASVVDAMCWGFRPWW
jgi:maleamate amidohydrolase